MIRVCVFVYDAMGVRRVDDGGDEDGNGDKRARANERKSSSACLLHSMTHLALAKAA